MSPFNLYTCPPFIAAWLNIALAILALYRNPRQALNQTFALLNICMAMWNANNFFLYTLHDQETILHVTLWTRDFLVFMYSTFFHFVLCFTQTTKRVHRRWLSAAYGTSLVFLIANHIPGMFITTLRHYFWGYYPVAGPVGHLFPLVFNVYIIYAMVLLYRAAERAAGFHRHQYKLLFLATLIFFGSAWSNFLLVLGYASYPFGNIGNIVYSLLVGYAVVSYGLMDIQIALRRGFVFLGLGTALSFTYMLIVVVIKQLFLVHDTQSVHQAFEVAAVPLTLAAAPRLKSMLEPIAVKVPFWRTYDYKTIVQRLSQKLLTILDLSELSNYLAKELDILMETDGVAIYVRPSNSFRLLKMTGTDASHTEMLLSDPAVQYVIQRKKPFVTDIIRWEAEHGEDRLPHDLLSFAKEIPLAILAPLFFHDELIGLISLGHKSSGEMYNTDDLHLLNTLAGSMAMAISNAQAIKTIEEQQRQMERQREMVLMGTLATEMAHELTKPLTHIMNAGAQLEHSAKGLPKEGFRTIEKEAQRASEILDGFSMLSPERELHRIFIPLAELIDEAISSIGIKEDRQVHISYDYQSTHPLAINPGQMVQVLTNVIQNAWQSMPNGGKLTISLCDTKAGDVVSGMDISILDTGHGIPTAIQDKIFEPFFTTKQDRGGRGMGLTISRAMVERHGGTITASSPFTRTTGTRVVIHLPYQHVGGIHEN